MYWGTSRWSAVEIMEAYTVARQCHLVPPVAEQTEYHMFHRDKVELQLPELCQKIGIGTMSWSPQAFGVLTGKFDEGVNLLSRGSFRVDRPEKAICEESGGRFTRQHSKLQELSYIADRLGCSCNQLTIGGSQADVDRDGRDREGPGQPAAAGAAAQVTIAGALAGPPSMHRYQTAPDPSGYSRSSTSRSNWTTRAWSKKEAVCSASSPASHTPVSSSSLLYYTAQCKVSVPRLRAAAPDADQELLSEAWEAAISQDGPGRTASIDSSLEPGGLSRPEGFLK
ncbi:hypothetical protein HPB51_021319 [Rhipicephalus microplus]|uniref:NADP-dependent oxidoreductase domain-containing protein n=1 Tax=Rhipicephalus microplus TaxID=6941 RepID=A0A9J6F6B0_RHIMP|nr:hypothetical protein HPB51_021319 [Rhipicephalus microplus]